MQIIKYPSPEEWKSLIVRQAPDNSGLFETTETILEDVRKNGDKAVLAWGQKLTGQRWIACL